MTDKERSDGVVIVGDGGSVAVWRSGRAIQLEIATAREVADGMLATVSLAPPQQRMLAAVLQQVCRAGVDEGDSGFVALADAVEQYGGVLEEAIEGAEEFSTPKAALNWAYEVLRPALSMSE